MQDRTDIRATATGGDVRAGAALALGGTLLLGATLTRAWAGPVAIPAALAVALLVFGLYLLALRGGAVALAAGRHGIGHFESALCPVFVTDLAGRMLARNPAARGDDPLAAASADPEAARYRLTREARLNGVAAETAADGRSRVVVTRHGRRSLLWRIEPVEAPRSAASLRDAGVPWLRLDAENRVLDANAAAAALAGGPPSLDMLADPPLRPDGVHVLARTGRAVRAMMLPGADGSRDLLLVPLDGAEVSGLVPDHFLDELPVALARLETDGRLTYANTAARQLLGDRATPGVNLADLIEGLGRPIAERLADTTRAAPSAAPRSPAAPPTARRCSCRSPSPAPCSTARRRCSRSSPTPPS